MNSPQTISLDCNAAHPYALASEQNESVKFLKSISYRYLAGDYVLLIAADYISFTIFEKGE